MKPVVVSVTPWTQQRLLRWNLRLEEQTETTEKPLDLQRMTELSAAQHTELTCLIHHRIGPLTRPGGRPAALGLYRSVALVVALHRHNLTQDMAGATFDVSQATVSRRWNLLRPVIAQVLEDFVPTPEHVAGGSTLLVDGFLAPVWDWKEATGMYSGKHQDTGFNLQVAATLSGSVVAVGAEPVPGSRHDAYAYGASGLADALGEVDSIVGDKGYEAHVDLHPAKKPQGGQLTQQQQDNNTVIESVRAAVERVISHLQDWKMLSSRYRAPLGTFGEALGVIVGLYFFTYYHAPYE